MTDFKMQLASELVTEQKTVTYRNLARSQKVHVNSAKCMLYEFYESQKKRKPGSVYATYLLAGIKKREHRETVKVDEDVSMRSSPPPTSSMPQSQPQNEDIEVKTITLVREEDLDDIKSTYETISSIHIYSLSPVKIPDLMALSDVTRGLYTDVFAKEDPLLHNKTYGVIQNPQVRRRKGKRPTIPSAPAPKFQAVKEEKKAAPSISKETQKQTTSGKPVPTLKKENSLPSSQPTKKDNASSRESTPKPASLKRDASDIFKAFAKGNAKPKQPKMMDTDDGEEDETLFEDKKKPSKRTSEVKQDRDDKAAKLRKMMDSDDESEKPAAGTQTETPATEPAEEENVDWSDSDHEKPGTASEKPDSAPATQEDTGPKRKRGKRKVMKKRTMKDEDGYLVTKEEEAWESFSESDTEKEKQKAFAGFQKKAPPPSKKAAAPASSGAAGGKKNIMSFFGKK